MLKLSFFFNKKEDLSTSAQNWARAHPQTETNYNDNDSNTVKDNDSQYFLKKPNVQLKDVAWCGMLKYSTAHTGKAKRHLLHSVRHSKVHQMKCPGLRWMNIYLLYSKVHLQMWSSTDGTWHDTHATFSLWLLCCASLCLSRETVRPDEPRALTTAALPGNTVARIT